MTFGSSSPLGQLGSFGRSPALGQLGYPWSSCPPGQEWAWGEGGEGDAQPGCKKVDENALLVQLGRKLFDGAAFPGDSRAQRLQYGYYAAKAILEKYDDPGDLTYDETEQTMQSIGEAISQNMTAVIEQMQAYSALSLIPANSLSLQGHYQKAIMVARALFKSASELITVYIEKADEALKQYRPAEFNDAFFETDVMYRLSIFQIIIEMDRRGVFGAPKASYQAASGYGSPPAYGSYGAIEAAPLITPQVAAGAILLAIAAIAFLGWMWIRNSQAIVQSISQACIETKDPVLCKTAKDMAAASSPNSAIDHAVNVVVGGLLIYAFVVYGLPALAEKIPRLTGRSTV